MQLTKDIISLDCTVNSHVYLVHEKDGWTIIDTGFPKLSTNILAELKQLKINLNEIKRILLTHGDIDHIGNLKPLQEVVQALVYADANELPYLAKQKHYSFRKTLFKLLLHIPKFKNIQPLPDNQIGEIKIIRTPGHTPGHVCYVYKEYLFAGDLFNTREGQITLMDDKYTYDKSQSINSIKLLDVKNIKYLCPAHGNVIEVQPSWDNFIKTLN